MTPRSSKDQFNANADKYAVSDVHRAGPSLPVLLALARPVQTDQALDVATGTGHTALAVARFVAKMTGIVPGKRLNARLPAAEQAVSIVFMEGSAEKIPLVSQGVHPRNGAAYASLHAGVFLLPEVRRVLTLHGRFVMADQILHRLRFTIGSSNGAARDPSHMQRTVEQCKKDDQSLPEGSAPNCSLSPEFDW
jgi:SAM-dependent methyltransferase